MLLLSLYVVHTHTLSKCAFPGLLTLSSLSLRSFGSGPQKTTTTTLRARTKQQQQRPQSAAPADNDDDDDEASFSEDEEGKKSPKLSSSSFSLSLFTLSLSVRPCTTYSSSSTYVRVGSSLFLSIQARCVFTIAFHQLSRSLNRGPTSLYISVCEWR